MAKHRRKHICVVRVTLGTEAQERWCTSDMYGKITVSCLGNLQSDYSGLDAAVECNLLSDQLHDHLRDILNEARKPRTDLVIVDFSSVASTAERYAHYCDDLCGELRHRIDQLPRGFGENIDLIIVVSDLNEFLKSVALRDRLEKTCASRRTGLVVLQIGTEPRAVVKSPSARLVQDCDVRVSHLRQQRVATIPERNVEQFIRESVDEVFGHFKVLTPINGSRTRTESHVTSLVSLERCLRDDRLIPFLQTVLERELDSRDFLIASIGLQGPDLDGVAQGIVNNASARFGLSRELRGRKVAILSDVLWGAYDLEGVVQSCRERGAEDVFVLGFASYKGFSSGTFRMKSFAEIGGSVYTPGEATCPYCRHGDKAVFGEYLDGYLAQIGAFHPYAFWELVASTEGAFLDGHWESPTTLYHYLHRVWCEPLFKKHGYGIAVRVRNLLTEHIYPDWIDTLLCPEEPNARLLAQGINQSLKTSEKQLVFIPRTYFPSVTGTSIPKELQEYLEGKYGQNPLQRRNVVIVDQAAHHFETLSALSHICRFMGGRVLAFAVAIDRLHESTAVSDWLPSSHYVSLYRWPWPPFKPDQCPCAYKRE
jgi:hypothetical protein